MGSPHPAWETALDRFGRWRSLQDLTEQHRREGMRELLEMREFFAGTRSPFDLTEELVMEFFQRLKARGLSTHSRRHYGSEARMFLRHAGAPAQRWIPSFPAPPAGDNGRYLEPEERSKLWAACLTPEDDLMLAMGLGNGFRRSDMLHLALEDLLPNQTAPTSVRFHGKGEKFYSVTVRMHPRLVEALAKYLPWREAKLATGVLIKRLEMRAPETVLVSTGYNLGIRPMARSTIDNRFRDLYRRARVDPGGWPSHNLRRTWADNRLTALMEEFSKRGQEPIMALDLAIRALQKEGRWKSAETVRRYLQRKMTPSEASWNSTAV